ncbi:hypothetical protein LshimejAT787_0208070 [Lyophyllum shimeji]|uniref:Uncharacterized protein n=1 Tax=Lyophyllum shimeji TaxID=47721 RepID=A0A9P3PFT9_LYOSH|nr:hypothetical protein LshimejAT787_0208070 [Lyophyllum shimeji]
MDLVEEAQFPDGAQLVFRFRHGLDSRIEAKVTGMVDGRPLDECVQDWIDAALVDYNNHANQDFRSVATKTCTAPAPPQLPRTPELQLSTRSLLLISTPCLGGRPVSHRTQNSTLSSLRSSAPGRKAEGRHHSRDVCLPPAFPLHRRVHQRIHGPHRGSPVPRRRAAGLNNRIEAKVAGMVDGRPSDEHIQDWIDAARMVDYNNRANQNFRSTATKTHAPALPPVPRNPGAPAFRTLLAPYFRLVPVAAAPAAPTAPVSRSILPGVRWTSFSLAKAPERQLSAVDARSLDTSHATARTNSTSVP